VTDEARPEDWPSLSSLAMRYGAAPGGLPASVVLPWYLQFPGQNRKIAGQTGGRMGEQHNAVLIQGDPSRADFEVQGLTVFDDVPWDRIDGRRQLLDHLAARPIGGEAARARYDQECRQAYALLEHRAGDVLDLAREPAAVRERYGPSAVGQSLLMARRLVESGVPLVTVNWEDETKIDGVNTCWDTHQQNFPKLRDLLCPIFDTAFPAFINDLDQRGLLETTLVVALGEFGRTPKIGEFTQSANTQKTGRDHWPHAFTALLAGGGVRGANVVGASDAICAHPTDLPVSPADVVASIYHAFGLAPQTLMHDPLGRPLAISEGHVIRQLF
jgi:hypothetical protein